MKTHNWRGMLTRKFYHQTYQPEERIHELEEKSLKSSSQEQIEKNKKREEHL